MDQLEEVLRIFYFVGFFKIVRYFWGRVSYFNQSEARKQCYLDSDWLKYEPLSSSDNTVLYCLT